MKITKTFCLIVFTLITILFTIGYSALPIFTTQSLVPLPSATNGEFYTNESRPASSTVSSTFYITYFTSLINDIQNTYTNTKYSNLGSTANVLFNTLLYGCITVSCMLTIAIIFALIGIFGFTFISKILFGLALFLMIIIFIIILLIILKNNILNISSIISNINNVGNVSNLDITHASGYTLMTIATGAMLVNYLLYSFLG